MTAALVPRWRGSAAFRRWLGLGLLCTGLAGAAWLHALWFPQAREWTVANISRQQAGSVTESEEVAHAADGGGSDTLPLSPQARRNLGLTPEMLRPVRLETFRRTVSVPAMVVGRPGRTQIEVSTPMAGVVTHVHVIQGEAVAPETLLFELRITAQELVATQTELLQTVGELDVARREIERLREVTESGAVSQKTLLEQQYRLERLQVLRDAQQEALRLQGLSESQITDIVTRRRLLSQLKLVAPRPDDHDHGELRLSGIPVQTVGFQQVAPDAESPAEGEPVSMLILQEVLVHKGETVAAGATLGVVSDFSELHIEGRAFEQDAALLLESNMRGWPVTARFPLANGRTESVEGLDWVYTDSVVDATTRSLNFYVRLPNRIVRQTPSPNGQQYVEWKYRPGQRLQLEIPVEEWPEQIVVPTEAVAREGAGAEAFVFRENGPAFTRVAVHVLYRDRVRSVIANDGAIFPGDVIALTAAHQLQMAIKNQSGGGVDPHAGHNH